MQTYIAIAHNPNIISHVTCNNRTDALKMLEHWDRPESDWQLIPTEFEVPDVKSLAFEWGVDYKPWEENLRPQDYGRYGYEQGYLRALRDILGVQSES